MSSVQDFYLQDVTAERSERYSVPLDGSHLPIGPFPFRPRSIVLVNQTTQTLIAQDDRGEQYVAAQSIGATYGIGDTIRLEAWLDKAPSPVQGKASVIVSDQPAGISAAQLSSFAAVAGGGASEVLAYNEQTAPVTINAVTEPTANAIVTAPSITLDGATKIRVEFELPDFQANSVAGTLSTFVLFEDGVSIGRMGLHTAQPSNAHLPITLSRVLQPLAGAHIYSVRAFVAANTSTANCGAGGANTLMPAYIRISKEAVV